jgi:hypothetical protein
MGMSLWDQFDLFKAADAADLAFPGNASEAKALLTKMQMGYGKALSETFLKHYETGHPGSIKSGVENRYPPFDTPLPEAHLYSRMLEMHAMVLFRPDFSPASCSCFHDWHKDETGLDGVLSCNFDAQEFSRDELHRWLTFHGIESVYAFRPPAVVAHAPSEPLDEAVLATPEELVKAFGVGRLKEDWFNSPRKHGWLLAARKRVGVGGNQAKPALYCPYEVMVGLATKTRPRDKAPRMREEKGWQILRRCFPEAHAKFAHRYDGGQSY